MLKNVKKISSDNSSELCTVDEIPEQCQWIAESAYYKALARGFTPIYDKDDWFEAIKEYNALLLKQKKNGLVSLR